MMDKVTRTIHLIAWIERNTAFIDTAFVLAEYLAKTAIFTHMPPEAAKQCKDVLSSLGVHVDDANNEALAKCAIGMALPALQRVFPSNDSHAVTALVDAVSITQDIMHRIHDVARAPDVKPTAHSEMAQFISTNSNPTVAAFEEAARGAYGGTAHWLAMALPGMKSVASSDAKTIEKSLGAAYDKCKTWARAKVSDIRPEVHHVVGRAVQERANGLHAASAASSTAA
jgi:antitoxin component of RelBE/YafQ-DinJ toxin-antitoxin module